MTDKDFREKIQKAITFFEQAEATSATENLLNTLGYTSSKKANINLDSLKKRASGKNLESVSYANWEEWKSANLIFQYTDDEVRRHNSLFDFNVVKEDLVQSYLFFSIELKEKEYTRGKLSEITRFMNRLYDMPVMVIFRYGKCITISVINRRGSKRDASKDVLEKVTLIKDIDSASPHRAHIEILFDLSFDELQKEHEFTNFVTLHEAWQKTLDTKELNKRFFRDLAYWYFWAMDHVKFPDDVEKKEDVRNATNLIRLITRVIFIWFIKEKDLVPDSLFRENNIRAILKDFAKNKSASNYYSAILQNLFFGTLNQKMGERGFAKEGTFTEHKDEYGVKTLYRYADKFTLKEKEIVALFKDVPFLNGGLFDCLDKPDEKGTIIYVDGFSRNAKKQATVPDFLFFSDEIEYDLNKVFDAKNKKYKVQGLINLLNNYKFTVAENTPIEEEVALDPELLGKVFENLLASYNPETQTTARKQTGSFYTPREIVNYMVDESLLAHLKSVMMDSAPGVVEVGKGQIDALGNTTRKGQLKLESPVEKNPWKEREPELEALLRELLSYSEKPNPFNDVDTKRLIAAIDACKILDPACGSGAFPMGVLHKMVHLLHKLDKENVLWKELQKRKAIAETEEAYNIGNKEEREKRLLEINDVFDQNINDPDYARKLYLIENCIYGVDIQPIAVQIAKLRFFISLIIDQNKTPAKENYGIRSLPNLETKFVAANTLIGLDKPAQTLLRNPEIERKENELRELRHNYFTARTRKEKIRYQREDKTLRKEIAKLLEDDGWNTTVAKQIVAFDPYDQNTNADWFDLEWMFGLSTGFDIVLGNPPYGFREVLSASEKTYFRKTKKIEFSSGDSAELFCIISFNQLVKEKGILTFIIPKKSLYGDAWENMRVNYWKRYDLRFLLDTGKSFENVLLEASVFGLIKNIPTNKINLAFLEKDGNIVVFGNTNTNYIFLENNTCQIYKVLYPVELFKNIHSLSHKQPKIKTHLGLAIGQNYFSDKETKYKLLKGIDIERYSIKSHRYLCNYDEIKPASLLSYLKPKVIAQRIVAHIENPSPYLKITACYDEEGVAITNTLMAFLPDKDIDPKFLLAYLNTKFVSWYAYNFVYARAVRTMDFYDYYIQQLPIPVVKLGIQILFSRIVHYISTVKKQRDINITTEFFERLIDAMIYELFFPESIQAGNCEALKHLTNLPELKEDWDDAKKLKTIEKVYNELSNPAHPVSIAMQKMQEIEEVKIIEGKV